MTESENITKLPARWLNDDALKHALCLWGLKGIEQRMHTLASEITYGIDISTTRTRMPPPISEQLFRNPLPPTSLEFSRSPPPDALRAATGKPRKPTLASAAKQARKLGIAVARYEMKPDGTVVIVTGNPETAEPENPWLAELRKKETKK
jgi:hypothetical protein